MSQGLVIWQLANTLLKVSNIIIIFLRLKYCQKLLSAAAKFEPAIMIPKLNSYVAALSAGPQVICINAFSLHLCLYALVSINGHLCRLVRINSVIIKTQLSIEQVLFQTVCTWT